MAEGVYVTSPQKRVFTIWSGGAILPPYIPSTLHGWARNCMGSTDCRSCSGSASELDLKCGILQVDSLPWKPAFFSISFWCVDGHCAFLSVDPDHEALFDASCWGPPAWWGKWCLSCMLLFLSLMNLNCVISFPWWAWLCLFVSLKLSIWMFVVNGCNWSWPFNVCHLCLLTISNWGA